MPMLAPHAAPLTARDDARLRALLRTDAAANLFAIADLDHFGWDYEALTFTGLFVGARLAGYVMCYGTNSSFTYDDPACLPLVVSILRERKIRFVNGPSRDTAPLIAALHPDEIVRHEPSTLAVLRPERFNRAVLAASPGRAWRATLHDLDGAARAHVAAPDQFGKLDFTARRAALRSVITDGWRRLFVAAAPDGTIVAAAQTTAEAIDLAMIGGVVTNPAFRERGYSTACTGALCAELLAEGKSPHLFYSRTNAPAARVYSKIGFEPIGGWELAEVALG